MNSHTTSGMIVYADRLSIAYQICRLDYICYEDESFEYIFTPDYGMIDLLPKEFQGIPGIDLGLRRETYIRKNVIPVFISERTPGENREDKWALLEEVGMDYLDPVEWLLRTDRKYFGDRLTMVRCSDDKEPIIVDSKDIAASRYCRQVLNGIGTRKEVIVDGVRIDDSAKKTLCHVLRSALMSDKRSSAPTKEGRGRKRVDVDSVSIIRAVDQIKYGLRTSDQAAKELGISKATLYRRIRELEI